MFLTRPLLYNAAPIPALSPHRHWRVKCFGDNSGSGAAIAIAELELRGSVGGADLTGSGTASASNASNGAASNAFDGDAGTFWATNTDAVSWIAYDFGAGNDVTIYEIAITARASTNQDQSPSVGYVEHSDDGSNWTPAWPFAIESNWSGGGQKVFARPTAGPTTHRYWKMIFGSSTFANYVGFSEIEMRGSPGGADQTGSGTPSADSDGFGAVANGFDNNLSTNYISNAGSLHWCKYDFGAGNDVLVKELSLRARTGTPAQYPRGIGLMFSDDDVNYTIYDAFDVPAAPTDQSPNIYTAAFEA